MKRLRVWMRVALAIVTLPYGVCRGYSRVYGQVMHAIENSASAWRW